MTADEIVRASTREHRLRNGIPEPAEQVERAAAVERVRETLPGAQVLTSPLGPGWTEVVRVSGAPPAGELMAAGWLPLDPLRRRLGLRAGGWWAVPNPSDPQRVALAAHLSGAAPDDVPWVLRRARERGEVRLLDVLELVELRRRGAAFPAASPVLTAAADIEVGLGRRELVRWTSGRRAAAPLRLARGGPQRRVVVAVTGVDGAGKSTVLEGLAGQLARCALPVGRVWLRPGMGLGPLAEISRRVKRGSGLDDEPGINRVAADPDAVLPTRRGRRAWVWALLVTLAFVGGVRRQHAGARGVVLYDRHLVDALVTLDFAYRGVDLRLQRWLVRRLVPRADVWVHLDVPVEEAVRRKPGDQIGPRAVARQVEAYDAWLARLPGVTRLDGTRDVGSLVREVLDRVLAGGRRPIGRPDRPGAP